MTLLLRVPQTRAAALRWAAGIVFDGFLGVPVGISEHADETITISGEGRTLTMPSLFPDLGGERDTWRKQVPAPPLTKWDVSETFPETGLDAPLPVLFGGASATLAETAIDINADIFGAIFFMLSRFEEVALPDRDRHDRFPATASLACKAGFLYRPVVDEYVEILWVLMKRLWPGLERKRRQGAIRVSCDVDRPFDPVGNSPVALLKVLRHELLVARKPARAASRSLNFLTHHLGTRRFDPYHTFDWYMDTCERAGLKAAFHFLCDNTAGHLDASYRIDEREILLLLASVHGRGHEIGMHGSYNTFRNPPQIAAERKKLERACESAGLDVTIAGNRQHYLRWDSGETPDHLAAAGFVYDTTGSFADRPGFRFGTGRPFAMWSWQKLAPLSLIQRPLLVMECSVISKGYLELGHSEDALDLMMTIKRNSLKSGGDFTLLWHNSELMTPEDKYMFSALIG